MKNDQFAQQVIAELLDAQEQAFALLTLSIADVIGKAPLSDALEARLAKAQSAQRHPIRDRLLKIARAGLKTNP
jgi:hypothetical protein